MRSVGCVKPAHWEGGVPPSADSCSDAATAYLCPELLVKMLLFGHCRGFNYFLRAVTSHEAPLANGARASSLARAALIALISALLRLTAPPGGPGGCRWDPRRLRAAGPRGCPRGCPACCGGAGAEPRCDPRRIARSCWGPRAEAL